MKKMQEEEKEATPVPTPAAPEPAPAPITPVPAPITPAPAPTLPTKKVIVDREKSDKATIERSVLGRLIMSDNVCKNCGAPVLVEDWESCAKCGGDVAVPKGKYKPKSEEKPKEEPKEEKVKEGKKDKKEEKKKEKK